jgi:hypothetical protein
MYWKYFLLPGTIFIIERIYRYYISSRTVSIISITNMKGNVISIEFDKSVFPNGYKEGQYCYIKCPPVSEHQWHPFTISSAPGDDTVTFHIKVMGRNSWTRKVLEYFSAMGPLDSSYFELADSGSKGVQVGKSTGPLGEKMLQVYGPHSAPTQHAPEYMVDIIIGSGIGVTPVSSTMQEVVYHRWAYNIGDSNPEHAYFVWVCSHKELESFRWMMRIVKECQDEVEHLRKKSPHAMNSKTFEVHIFVTSVPEGQKSASDLQIEDDVGFWGRPRKPRRGIEKSPSLFSEEDLYKGMLAPPKGSPLQIGDVRIYNSRPAWNKIFEPISQRHSAQKVGVMFCGNPQIGADLRGACRKYTNMQGEQGFVLHKENF